MESRTTDPVALGRRLRELREQRGIPKEQIALALRMSAGNWAHFESGRNQLKATMLPTLEELFGLTVAELAAELLDEEPGHTLAHTGQHSHTRKSANYIYTESRRGLSQPGPARSHAPHPSRTLVAAGR